MQANSLTRGEKRKLQWFRTGAESFAQLQPGLPVCYVCPLCLRGVHEDHFRLLTFEDVPPKSIGGRKLVLTCKECNASAGGADGVDTHARRLEKVREVVTGSPSASAVVRIRMSDVELNVSVEGSDEGMLVQGLKENNPEGRTSELKDVLESAYQQQSGMPDLHMSFPLDRFSVKRAVASWLRAAYLASFAKFGYRYILHDTLTCVRRQIAEPNTELIPGFHQSTKGANPTFKRIVVIASPKWARGLHVQMGSHVVFLPFLDRQPDYYKTLRENALRTGRIRISGTPLAWPMKAEFLLDQPAVKQEGEGTSSETGQSEG